MSPQTEWRMFGVSIIGLNSSYGSWTLEENVRVLIRVKDLQLQIIKYLQQLIRHLEDQGEEAFKSILNKIAESKDIQNQIDNLAKHPIMSKIDKGRFGQNGHPLLGIAALVGPPFAGFSFYWSLVALILVGIINVHRNEGDLKSFQQFLELFDDIATLLTKNLE
ncbi:hypothetical protein G9A89_013573 [Geosiphon pyriformis]|nr:hypothetical protein G9A89_013573 [Geosiphon pyriformis]